MKNICLFAFFSLVNFAAPSILGLSIEIDADYIAPKNTKLKRLKRKAEKQEEPVELSFGSPKKRLKLESPSQSSESDDESVDAMVVEKIYPRIDPEYDKDKNSAFGRACRYYLLGDFMEWLKAIKEGVGLGDARCIFDMASACEYGIMNIILVDKQKAKNYYLKSASLGCSEAQFQVAYYYNHGLCNFPCDINKAIYWYKKAASNDNPSALAFVNLGILYEEGKLVTKNIKEAFANFEIASHLDENDGSGTYRLSLCYKYGTGVVRDRLAYYKWLKIAADKGCPEAMNDLALHYEKLNQIKKAQHWFHEAARSGSDAAQYNLGIYFENKNNKEAAKSYFEEAARLGNQDAMEALAQYNL